MKLVSWNANGIRSLARKGLAAFLAEYAPDIFCVQETRAWTEQLDPEVLEPAGYRSWWSRPEKKGYSGVCLYSRPAPETRGTSGRAMWPRRPAPARGWQHPSPASAPRAPAP